MTEQEQLVEAAAGPTEGELLGAAFDEVFSMKARDLKKNHSQIVVALQQNAAVMINHDGRIKGAAVPLGFIVKTLRVPEMLMVVPGPNDEEMSGMFESLAAAKDIEMTDASEAAFILGHTAGRVFAAQIAEYIILRQEPTNPSGGDEVEETVVEDAD